MLNLLLLGFRGFRGYRVELHLNLCFFSIALLTYGTGLHNNECPSGNGCVVLNTYLVFVSCDSSMYESLDF